MDWGLAAPVIYLTGGQVAPTELFGYAWEPDAELTDRLKNSVAQPATLYLWRAPDEIIFDRSPEFKAEPNRFHPVEDLTGDESRATELTGVPLPHPLNPVDDLPPQTVITHIEQKGDQVVVRGVVADNGPGISAAAKASLFRPFISAKPNGMGIGLAVSRAIAEAHGGTLDDESRSHGQFRLVLPVEHTHA